MAVAVGGDRTRWKSSSIICKMRLLSENPIKDPHAYGTCINTIPTDQGACQVNVSCANWAGPHSNLNSADLDCLKSGSCWMNLTYACFNDAMEYTTDDDTSQRIDALAALVPALGQILLVVAMGYYLKNLKLLPEHTEVGLRALAGTIGLPLLYLQSISRVDVRNIDLGLIAALVGAKLCAFVLAVILGYATFPKRKGTEFAAKLAIGSCWSNDVAIGLPIVQALYGANNMHQYTLLVYSVVSAVIVNPWFLSLFQLLKQQRRQEAQEKSGEYVYTSSGATARTLLCTMAKTLLSNPLVWLVLLGLILNLLFHLSTYFGARPWVSMPAFATNVIDYFTKAYPASALLLTGMSMANDLEDESEEGADEEVLFSQGSPRLSQGSPSPRPVDVDMSGVSETIEEQPETDEAPELEEEEEPSYRESMFEGGEEGSSSPRSREADRSRDVWAGAMAAAMKIVFVPAIAAILARRFANPCPGYAGLYCASTFAYIVASNPTAEALNAVLRPFDMSPVFGIVSVNLSTVLFAPVATIITVLVQAGTSVKVLWRSVLIVGDAFLVGSLIGCILTVLGALGNRYHKGRAFPRNTVFHLALSQSLLAGSQLLYGVVLDTAGALPPWLDLVLFTLSYFFRVDAWVANY